MADYSARQSTCTLKFTDDAGCVKFTGFRGDYEVSSAGKSSSFKLSKETGTVSVTF